MIPIIVLVALLVNSSTSSFLFSGPYCGMVSKGASKQLIIVDVDPMHYKASISWSRNGISSGSKTDIPYGFDQDNHLVLDTSETPIEKIKFDATNNILRASVGTARIGLWRLNCVNTLLTGVYRGINSDSTTSVTIDGLFAIIKVGDQVDKLRYTDIDLDGKFVFQGPNRGIHITYASSSDALLLQSWSAMHVLLPEYLATTATRYEDETVDETPAESMAAHRQRSMEAFLTGIDF